jgi:hypothetical protein
MEANLAPVSAPSRARIPESSLVDRVIVVLAMLRSTDVWARGAGRHVLLGLTGQEPFARLTAFGGGAYGLAFQSGQRGQREQRDKWELLLIDGLTAVVEHALVACTADGT